VRPSSEAFYVATLAGGGILGGDVHRILWELPLAQGLQLQHAILLARGVRTTFSEADLAKSVEKFLAELKDDSHWE
jgi:hypothetical protein